MARKRNDIVLSPLEDGNQKYAIRSNADFVVLAGPTGSGKTYALYYAPIEYPAAADFEVISALKSSADKLNLRSHLGVVQSKDSFYGQHSPTTKPVANDLITKWEAWKRLNVLCSEMEAAALFTVAASLGCKAGAAFHILWNQEKKEIGVDEQKNLDTSNAVKCVVNAINILSENDKNR